MFRNLPGETEKIFQRSQYSRCPSRDFKLGRLNTKRLCYCFVLYTGNNFFSDASRLFFWLERPSSTTCKQVGYSENTNRVRSSTPTWHVVENLTVGFEANLTP